jgi:transposase
MMDTMKSLDGSRALRPEAAKRRTYSEAYKRQVVELTLVPGASVAKIALDHQLNANMLFTWRRQHLQGLAGSSRDGGPKMLPVRLRESSAVMGGSALEPGSATPPMIRAGTPSAIEIDVPGGRIRLKGAVDAEALRVVVEILSGR